MPAVFGLFSFCVLLQSHKNYFRRNASPILTELVLTELQILY